MEQENNGRSTRRRFVQGVGGAGVVVGLGSGLGAAKPSRNRNRGNQGYDCPEGAVSLGTFEFVVEEDEDGNIVDCYFEQTDDGEALVTITSFENKVDENGEEEACEPISVTYEVDGYTVESVASFGGNDTHVDSDPEDGTYESDLVNPGGQQAAVSTLYICGTEVEDLE